MDCRLNILADETAATEGKREREEERTERRKWWRRKRKETEEGKNVAQF